MSKHEVWLTGAVACGHCFTLSSVSVQSRQRDLVFLIVFYPLQNGPLTGSVHPQLRKAFYIHMNNYRRSPQCSETPDPTCRRSPPLREIHLMRYRTTSSAAASQRTVMSLPEKLVTLRSDGDGTFTKGNRRFYERVKCVRFEKECPRCLCASYVWWCYWWAKQKGLVGNETALKPGIWTETRGSAPKLSSGRKLPPAERRIPSCFMQKKSAD